MDTQHREHVDIFGNIFRILVVQKVDTSLSVSWNNGHNICCVLSIEEHNDKTILIVT